MVIRNLRRFTEAQHAHEYPLCSRLIARFRAHGGAVRRRPLPRHREGPRRRPFHARRARCAPLLRAARHCEGRLRTGRVAGRASPGDVVDCAEAGHHRSAQSSPTSRRRSGHERRLIALYLLTVADIRGTSPEVWNAWKGKLLEDLFRATRRVLAGDLPRRRIAGQRPGAAGGGAAAAAPLRSAGRRRARAVEAARHALLPAPHGGRDRLAYAPPVLARRTHGSRW